MFHPTRRKQETPYSRDENRPAIGSLNRFPQGLWTFRSQGTEDWLLLLVVSGKLGVLFPDDSSAIFPRGHVLLYAPGTTHDFGVIGRHWETSWIHFTPRTDWMDLLHWPEISPGVAHLDLTSHRDDFLEMLEAMKRLHHALRADESLIHFRARAMNALEGLLLLGDACARRLNTTRIDDRIARVLPILRERWLSPPSAKQLARLCGLSLSRFYALFHAVTGLSVGEFIEHQRIEQAKLLLGTSLQSIKSIAHSVGFTDPYYFSRRFTLLTGRGPRAFRASLHS